MRSERSECCQLNLFVDICAPDILPDRRVRGTCSAQGGVNLYEYVAGRAVVGVDPSGMLTEADCDSELNNCVSDCWNKSPPWPFRRNKGYYVKCEEGCNKAYLDCLKSLEPVDCPLPGPAIDIAEGAGAAAEDLTVGDVLVDVIIGIALF